jgi:hypothetical protein
MVLGIIGLVGIERSGGRLTGRGLAIGGIVVPVLAVPVLLMMVILTPSLHRAKEQAKTVVCMTNLKQWALAVAMYSDDHDGCFWGHKEDDTACWWMDRLRAYCGDNEDLLLCPMAVKPYTEGGRNPFAAWKVDNDLGSYGLNGWTCKPQEGQKELRGRGPAENYWGTPHVKRASNMPIFLDAMWANGWPRQADEPPPYEDWLRGNVTEREMKANDNEMRRFCLNRHKGFVNCLFMDFSVRRVGLKELWTLKWHREYDPTGPWTRAGGVRPEDWPEWMRKFKDY